MIPEYKAAEIEKKWQKKWETTKLYRCNLQDLERKLYCLVMFIYPSGDKLHIGHWYNYAPTDTWARFKRMQGFNVFEPMGYDAFGLPAENYAIKMGVHPAESTEKNINVIREQLKAMGAMYDWDHEINTSRPEYYQWTQWLFLQLYKNGLAYRKKAAANWCPTCQTVLANEQVVDGYCERCESEVLTRDLEQWFFRITRYAEQLLDGHNQIQWPEKTISMQKNWIGKSIGATIDFKVVDHEDLIQVFTTRPDTLFGVTYMVLAPEHPLVEKLTRPEKRAEVDAYILQARKLREIDRTSTEKEKTGVFIGSYCVNPVNKEQVPIWIADYVLVTYGTGAVMAVPAHDQRDFEFAQKYHLPIRKVISPNGEKSEDDLTQAFEETGVMIDSGQFSGMESTKGIDAVVDYLWENGCGDRRVNYKLRDWLISRQRYWGAPIPIIYCEGCGEVPVPESDLPVLLPENVEFKGKGISPLATSPDFVDVPCPKCGKPARREIDTMDTFVCSSWYFLRFLTPKIKDRAFDTSICDAWLPVDQYVGGAEHAVMHLLYARFFVKALRDFGLIHFDEPFQRLVHQGTITNKGAKMSKSRGNVVNPDAFIEKYGADTFRMYMMFMGAYEEGGDWSDEGIVGIYRFLRRIWRIVLQIHESKPCGAEGTRYKKVVQQMHYAIKNCTGDLERFHFNTSISRIMELVNEISLYIQNVPANEQNRNLNEELIPNLLRLIAPFAPHFAEELWERIGKTYSIFDQKWPEHDESQLIKETTSMGIQINGKIRGQIEVAVDVNDADIIKMAMDDEKIKQYIKGKTIQKALVVKNKLVSLVIKDMP
ncbi:leucine--tRNA ligase [candidate division KSB1 bacterium]|nr:leucine--tRNA ligase [candidate division KSB1 bacterium]